MIRYSLVKGKPFDVYKDAADGVAVLGAIEKDVKKCYASYEAAVAAQNAHGYQPLGFAGSQKNALENLYNPQCEAAKKVRKYHSDFTRTNKRVYHNKCPYCNLSEPGTTEHILPKSAYPELAIHVQNLIPCCMICNGHKGTAVIDANNIPLTLNLYYHDPEKFEYLTVDCSLDAKGFPEFHYRLGFPKGADPGLAAAITNHYNRLHLLERYDEAVISLYTNLEVEIQNFLGKDLKETLENIKAFATMSGQNYGLNHYRTALLRCLIGSAVYHGYLKNLIKSPKLIR